MLAFCSSWLCLSAFFNFSNTKQTLKLISKNSRTIGGPLPPVGPPSLDAAATPSLRHGRRPHLLQKSIDVAFPRSPQQQTRHSGDRMLGQTDRQTDRQTDCHILCERAVSMGLPLLDIYDSNAAEIGSHGWKIYWYFSIGNVQPREPALCQLYRHTFVPYLMIS